MKILIMLLGTLVLAVFSGCNPQRNNGSTTERSSSNGATSDVRVDDSRLLKDGDSSQTPKEIVVIDRLKREVRFPSTPKRIVSLTPATTELLYAIGAGPQLVGATKNCNYPAEAEKLTRVGGGTLQSLSREAIVGLQPDLVLCKWDNHQPLMATLAEFNVPCLAIGAESLEELYAETSLLGKVTGHVEQAAELVSSMKQRVEKIATRVQLIPKDSKRKVFYEVWDDPLMTAGPKSFIGEALNLAGLENIFFDATTSYPRVSDEVVVARDPDVIVSPSTHASKVSMEKLLQRQGWSEVKAIREKRVYIIDGDHISRCGPRLLDAIEEMLNVAYPELGNTATEGVSP